MIKDEFTLPIPCPQCGKKLQESLRRLQGKTQITCTCGGRIEIPLTERTKITRMARELDNVEKSMRGLRDAFKKRR